MARQKPTPEQLAQRSAMAERIERHCAEQKIAMRQLSIKAGFDPSALRTVVERLKEGRDIQGGTRDQIATAMGRTRSWLETGVDPAGVRLSSLPEWATVSAEVTRLHEAPPELLALIGAMTLPTGRVALDALALSKILEGVQRATTKRT